VCGRGMHYAFVEACNVGILVAGVNTNFELFALTLMRCRPKTMTLQCSSHTESEREKHIYVEREIAILLIGINSSIVTLTHNKLSSTYVKALFSSILMAAHAL